MRAGARAVELLDAATVLDDPSAIASARRRTPGAVVVVSGLLDGDDVRLLLDAGADACIAAPLSPTAQAEAVAAILAYYDR